MSPCALFGLGALPFYVKWAQKLDAVQRKMFRNMVGWSRVSEDPWADTMRRMNARVSSALRQWYVKPWSSCVACRRWQHADRIKSMPLNWRSSRWFPQHVINDSLVVRPYRSRGGQFLRWDANMHNFSVLLFNQSRLDAPNNSVWLSRIKEYEIFCQNDEIVESGNELF